MDRVWDVFLSLLGHGLITGPVLMNIAASYFFCRLLIPGRFLSWNPRTRTDHSFWQIFRRLWLLYLIPLTGIVLFRIYVSAAIGTYLIHLTLLLGTFLLFEDRISKKLTVYFVLLGLLTMTEVISSFAAIVCILICTGRELSFVYFNSLNQPFEIVVVNIFYTIVCFPLVHYGAVLLRSFQERLRFRNIIPLFIPTTCITLGPAFVLYQENSPLISFRFAALILVDIICMLIFFLNLRSIATREREHEMLLKQAALVRQQLEYSNDIEEKYRKIRKQNHDIANQLQSLTWMIGNKHFQEANEYLDELIKMI